MKKITNQYIKKSINRLANLLVIDGVIVIIITALIALVITVFGALGAALGSGTSGEFFASTFAYYCITLAVAALGVIEIYRSIKIRKNVKRANEIAKTFANNKRIATSEKTENTIREHNGWNNFLRVKSCAFILLAVLVYCAYIVTAQNNTCIGTSVFVATVLYEIVRIFILSFSHLGKIKLKWARKKSAVSKTTASNKSQDEDF